MGGFGSGRPRSGRCTADECRSLDVNWLHKRGCLRAGWSGVCRWSCRGEQTGAASLRTEQDRLHLTYRVRIGGGDWEDVTEAVDIVHAPCHLGGTRPFFVCPGLVDGVACRRRVGKLYQDGRYFLCRHCYRLAYASQSEREWDRALRRANKVRQLLGGKPGMASQFPPKPKGMWRRTYARLSEQVFETELHTEEAFLASSDRLLARIESRRRGHGGRRSF